MDSKTGQARGLRTALRPRMGAGRNIGRGPGGEAPGSKRVLGDITEIFTHLQIIISLIKKLHEILSQSLEHFINNISTNTT